MNDMSRGKMIDILRYGPTQVTFKKKDGSDRVMQCTLKAELITVEAPEPQAPQAPREANLDIIKVFDLEAGAFRSFRVESVSDIKCAES
jgi:hypothetical protein